MYDLHGFITHLGASVHAGHYVCHLRRDGKWIYFNDAKVAETTDPPVHKGYIYFMTRVKDDWLIDILIDYNNWCSISFNNSNYIYYTYY